MVLPQGIFIFLFYCLLDKTVSLFEDERLICEDEAIDLSAINSFIELSKQTNQN